MSDTSLPAADGLATVGDATVNASSPAASTVASLITATNRTIADAHEHGRKSVRWRDLVIARAHFAIARRLARLAWRFAAAGKRRMT